MENKFNAFKKTDLKINLVKSRMEPESVNEELLWVDQVKTVEDDVKFKRYFTGRNLYDFIKMYVKVDEILNNNMSSVSVLEQFSKLNKELKESVSETIVLLNKDSDSSNNRTNEELDRLNKELKEYMRIQNENTLSKLHHYHTVNENVLDKKLITCLQNNPQINKIHDTLTSLHNSFTSNSSKKGEMAENMLFRNLLAAFPDSDIQNTSQIKDACDIQIKKDSKPDILIDSKHFESTNVPKRDLEKFYQNCETNGSCGILCNAFGGIANKKNFEIDIHDDRVYVYISNHQFDSSLFELAVKIIYNMHEIVKGKKTNNIELDLQMYQRMKTEYNFFLQSFQQHLDIIKQNINSLSQLCFTQLDHFFKRTNFDNSDKPFSCHLCGTGFKSAKAMNRHMREKHDFKTKGRKKADPKEKVEEKFEESSEGSEDNEQKNDGLREF